MIHSSRSVAACLWGATIAIAAPACAQDTAQPDGETTELADAGGLVDIVVTAQKRATNLQQTPISISVASAADLENRHVQSLADLADGAIPSLRIAPFFSRSSALTIGIRGIVPFDANQPSRDAGVGVYIDGVYLGRSQGLGTALLDVERIEVLKGPQGTLFGRNSTGGAVSIVTRKPSGEFALRQTAGIRNYNGYTIETHVDLPRFANISLKFDGIQTKRDGTTKNPLQGEDDFNRFDRRGFHAGALWDPAADFTALLDFDISRDETTPYYVQLLEANPAAPPRAPLVQVQPDRAGEADIGVPQQASIGHVWGLALRLNWKIGEQAELRSISSYRDLDQSQFDNGIGAHASQFRPNAAFARYSLASLRQHQASQELQLVGSLDRLDYVAGLYYYHEAGDDDAWTPNTLQWNATGTVATRLPSLAAGAVTPFPDRASTAKADSYAVFGQATFTPNLLDGILHVTAGGRYTHDKKSGRLFKVNGAETNFTFDISSDHFDPAVTIAIEPAGGLNLYGKYGTAFRSGGANSRSVNYRAFGEERVRTFEIGAKTELWDRRARINLAAYRTRYSDIQIDFSATNLNSSNRGTIETVNAPGHGTIEGFEADVTLAPVEPLTLSASYAYTKGDLPQAANPFRNGALQSVYIVYTPRHAATGAIDYRLPVGEMAFVAHLDANVAGGFRFSSGEATRTDKSVVVNGRIALSDIPLGRGASLQLAAWSRNLFDEQHRFVESRGAFAILGTYGIYNEPRTYGVDATLRF